MNDYQVGPVLGTGGFSVVRKGIRKEDGLEVAIKTLKKFGYGTAGGGVAEALVKNEILVMMRIVEEVSPHRNVIHLVDVYEDQMGVHLVLELCRGGELFDRIVTQERYSEAGAAAVVREIAAGLSKLHLAQIVCAHRDLKHGELSVLDRRPCLPFEDYGLRVEPYCQCDASSCGDVWLDRLCRPRATHPEERGACQRHVVAWSHSLHPSLGVCPSFR